MHKKNEIFNSEKNPLSLDSGCFGFFSDLTKPKQTPHFSVELKTEGFVIFIVFFGFMFFFTILNLEIFSALESAYGPEITGSNYVVSRSKVERVIAQGDVFRDYIRVSNSRNSDLEISFAVSDEILDIIEFEESGIIVEKQNITQASFLVKGKTPGNYSGKISLQGDLAEDIPVNISIISNLENTPVLINIELVKNKFVLNKFLEFKLNVDKLKTEQLENATFTYDIIGEDNNSYFLGSESINVSNSFQMVKRFKIPKDLEVGPYILGVSLGYEGRVIVNKAHFLLKRGFFSILIFGFLPMWLLTLLLAFSLAGVFVFFIIKRRIAKNKKYQMKLDTKTLPKKNSDYFFLGKIAETNIPAYLEPERLKTHTIVAGATGGGKSISAQVIVEEALIHNVAVVVFDPTAQWSGMLRKCTDKKMMSYYPKFRLKETDSRAFKGNVRQVKNAREVIDIKKYIHPGQIHILALSKLDPKDMDVFVASVIRQIFKSDPKEAPELKLLLVFDEVHRLLSKFGGSGEGFLQVERACREFRKWGMGVMLVSQVLSDFVGEIKANISTEVQMRTRDEGDLNRIKTKYGGDFLQSLVKASVGVGMVVNPAYNHARPYFLNFRPILHNTRRLSDEELEKYNQYNDKVDDLEYEIEQLEKEKVDTFDLKMELKFDLKMELKLVKDKIMTGNFSVVEIYLEGLVPRVEKEWQKLGKKPKKRQLQLVSEEEIKKSVEEAKKAREKFEKEESKKQKKEEKKEAPKEKIEDKQIKPLIFDNVIFDNGIMVGSLKELKNVLPGLDEEVLKTHVNENKNDIAKWIGENLSKELGESLKGIVEKQALISGLNNFGKESPNKVLEKKEEPEKKEDKPNKAEGKEKKPEGKTDKPKK